MHKCSDTAWETEKNEVMLGRVNLRKPSSLTAMEEGGAEVLSY